jgi:hypothetical protein
MEIQALTLLVTDQDLNELAARHLPADQPVENLRFRITSEGVHVSGEYPLFLRVSFRTLWELGVRGGEVTARLAHFKALGMPLAVFRSLLLKLVTDAAGNQDWLRMDHDTLLLHVDRALLAEGIPVRTNLTRIECRDGSLIVQGGSSPS